MKFHGFSVWGIIQIFCGIALAVIGLLIMNLKLNVEPSTISGLTMIGVAIAILSFALSDFQYNKLLDKLNK